MIELEVKQCRECNLIKNLNEFSPKRAKCKSCRAKYTREYSKNNKEKVFASDKRKYIRNVNFIYNYKLGKSCIDCKLSFHPHVLQFDHLSPVNKVKSISRLAGCSSINRIIREINKCELVCVNCHRERTQLRFILKSKIYKISKTPTRDITQKIISNIKEASPCIECNKFYRSYQMDFDHRDPLTKIHAISFLVSNQYPLDEILSEIAKCDLLCANCHAYRTSKQLNLEKHIIKLIL